MQASEAVTYRFHDEVRVDLNSRPSLDLPVLQDLDAADLAADHQTSEASVGDQNVRSSAQ